MIPKLHTLCFEAVEDGGEGTGGGLEQTETAAPENNTAIETTTATETPAGIDYESPEFQQAVASYASQASEQHIASLIEQAQAAEQAQQGYELPEFDPLNPEGFTEGLLGALDQKLEQALAPLTARLEQQQIAEAGDLADQMAAGLPEVATIGELLPEDKRDAVAQTIRAAAEGFLPAAAAQYGEGPQAVQAAMRASAAHLQGMFNAAHDAGKEAYKAEMAAVSGAAQTPGAANAGTQINGPARDEEEVALRWAQQHSS